MAFSRTIKPPKQREDPLHRTPIPRAAACAARAHLRWTLEERLLLSLPTVLAGLGAVAMLSLGFNLIVPLSETVGTVCDIAGIICALLFLGLAEDPGPQDNPILEFDRE